MKKEKFAFLIIPIVQVLGSARHFKTYQQVVSSFLLILSCFLISLLLYKGLSIIFLKYNISNKYITVPLILLLSFLDQAHKYILEITGFSCNIIGEFFQVKQIKNEYQMGILNYLRIEVDINAIICIKIVTLIIIIFFCIKAKDINLKIAFTLLVSAQISSILDTLFRGYILDSFYYYKLVCYDLKDYYVDAGGSLLLVVYVFDTLKLPRKNIEIL